MKIRKLNDLINLEVRVVSLETIEFVKKGKKETVNKANAKFLTEDGYVWLTIWNDTLGLEIKKDYKLSGILVPKNTQDSKGNIYKNYTFHNPTVIAEISGSAEVKVVKS